MLQRSSKGFSRKFQGHFKDVLRVFQLNSRLVQGCLKEVLRVFQGSFEGVSRVF